MWLLFLQVPEPMEELQEDGITVPFRQLSEDDLHVYYERRADGAKEAAAHLAACLQEENHTSDIRASVRVDFAMSVLDHARETHSTAVCTGVLFNISQTVLRTVEDGMELADSREGAHRDSDSWACVVAHATDQGLKWGRCCRTAGSA